MMELLHAETTGQIIKAAYDIYNQLGYGFLEKVYQRAMQVELLQNGLVCECESRILVKYKNVVVGEYFADLFVDQKVIVELKVAKKYNAEDEPQLLNELKATGIKVGMLVNFGKTGVEYKRLVY